MTISGEDISRVTNLLKLRPRGMSIAAIAKELHLNRNSVAKYLDLLTANGAVELTRVGPAKLYFTAPRVPVSGMINLSSDYFVMLDANLRVLYVNNNVLTFEDRTRPEVLQKTLEELGFALVADEAIGKYLQSTERDEMFQREVEVQKGEETFHFRVKIISTVYENGTQGTTILATDITTEKEQEKALRASEAEYRAVVEDQTELIFRFRPDRIFTFANDAFLRVIGKRREEVVGVPATFPVLDEDMGKIRQAYGSLSMDHPATGLEIRVTPADGSTRWMKVNYRAFFDERGNPWEYQAVAWDITDLKAAEEAIRESEARYRGVVESQQEGVLRFNPDGRFTFTNDAFCRFVGRSREEILGLDLTHLIPDIDIGRIRETYRSLTPDHPSTILEFRASRLDGETRWIQADFRGFFDDRGVPLEYQAVARDITELKAAERAIQESEEQIRAVMTTAPGIILTVNREGKILYANRGAGVYTAENVRGTSLFDYVPPDQQEMLRHHLGVTFTTGQPTEYEVQGYGPNGPGTAWYESHLGPVFQDGKVIAATLISLDITDRKKALTALEESEARYRAVVEAQQEGIVRFNPDGVLTFANDAFCRLVDRTRDQIIGSNVTHFIAGDDIARIRETYRSLNPEQPSRILEFRVRGVNGSIRWIQADFRGLFDAAGKFQGFQAVGRDITDLKAAERAIQESEARYRAVVEDQTEFICRFHADGTHSFVNDAYCRYFGKKREDLLGQRFMPQIPEEDRKKVAALLDSLTPENPVGSIDHPIIMPDGDVRWQRWVDRAIYGPDGHLVEYQSVGRDITERKRAQDLARAQFQSFPVPSYIWRRKGNDLVLSDYNDAAYRITRGLIPGQVGRTARDMFQDRPAIPANLERTLAEKTTIDEEVTYMFMTTGEKRDFLVRSAYLPPNGVLVYTMDLTERKSMEKALRASEEQYREMAETSPFPISIVDASGRYRYLNRKFTDIFGYTLDDVPSGRQWFDMAFPDPDQRHRAIAAWKDDLSRSHPGEIRPRQFPVRCRNGESLEVIFRPVTLRDGTQYITYEDVTERLTTLGSLRQSEARYRQLFNSMRCCFTLVEPVVDEKGIPVDLTFLDVNAAMERLSGRIREELVGQHLGDVLPGTPPELMRAIGAVALTGDPKKLAVYHPGLDRTLKVRAYSPWKGQCALIFKVVAPAGDDAGGKIPPPGNAS